MSIRPCTRPMLIAGYFFLEILYIQMPKQTQKVQKHNSMDMGHWTRGPYGPVWVRYHSESSPPRSNILTSSSLGPGWNPMDSRDFLRGVRKAIHSHDTQIGVRKEMNFPTQHRYNIRSESDASLVKEFEDAFAEHKKRHSITRKGGRIRNVSRRSRKVSRRTVSRRRT